MVGGAAGGGGLTTGGTPSDTLLLSRRPLPAAALASPWTSSVLAAEGSGPSELRARS
jgi:hypothetical protein